MFILSFVMITLKKILQKVLLTVLFTSALNLSLQLVTPVRYDYITQSGSTLNEQTFLLVPFREKETTQNLEVLTSLQSLPFTFISQWSPLYKNKITLELFYKAGFCHFKEYPFIVLVRNLRI